MVLHVLLPSEGLRTILTAGIRTEWALFNGVHSAREEERDMDLPERSLAGVRSKVVVQMLLAGERLLAHGAAERLVCRVSLHVPLEARVVGEHIVADIASEHFVAVVRLAVVRELHGGGERLPAHLANERLALVVVATMDNELILERENFAANVASVHGRRRHRRLVVVH